MTETNAVRPAAAPDRGGERAAPRAAAERIPFIDAARGLAMFGVVVMNALMFVVAAEHLGEAPAGPVGSALEFALQMLFGGKARALLMLLLGMGVVFAWRSAERRGDRPMARMAVRYAVLLVVFGLGHLAVFEGDILTHYATVALLLAPAVPLLLGGARRRPLAAAAALFAVHPFVEAYWPWSQDVAAFTVLVPQTLGFFCVGIWLARREETGEPERPTRLPAALVGAGLAGQLAGVGLMLLGDALFPLVLDAGGVPEPPVPAATALTGLAGTVTGLGGGLFYLGLVWWLMRRGRTAARLLGALVPLGRMSLTVYLLSTALFLAVLLPYDGRVTVAWQLTAAFGYFAVMAVAAPLWLRRFRAGPLEWVWRCLVYRRMLPLRRTPARRPGPAGRG
ncbi:DUF418 domain-containing protein [Nocardiopsis composta]|uniref:DUF418 domain-containing protein n=1 Tax=Nocardiopsis composta TaxID=157465 RepID=A0A7W8QKG3_9ACTN|nr:DUF418 domain-containing protein [Nocardiopsis composta]MBB5431445.1 uncharacterized protein [Nocardiopsis composta]